MKIGMASIDENGKAHGGKAGDQTGNEVKICNWYKYSKGWDCVLRRKDRNAAHSMAICMKNACNNNKIGYDQYNREDCLKQLKTSNWDFAKITTPTETDCSALVATVIICCGINENALRNPARGNALAYTGDLRQLCMATGQFDCLTDSKYLTSGDYLLEGDIILNEKNHVAMAIENGSKATSTSTGAEPVKQSGSTSSRTLIKGCKGEDVKTLQANLNKTINAGLTVDGSFGPATETAVKSFQKKYGLEADGKFGPKSQAKMNEVLKTPSISKEEKYAVTAKGGLNLREGVNQKVILVIPYNNEVIKIKDEENGWYKVNYNNTIGYVSSAYLRKI